MASLVILLFAAAIVAVVIAKKQSKHTFVCKNCGGEFQVKWTKLLFEVHMFNEHKLRCPHCNIEGFCKDKGVDYGKTEHLRQRNFF